MSARVAQHFQACAYCRRRECYKITWRGELLCSGCVGAVVRFRRQLNELPNVALAADGETT